MIENNENLEDYDFSLLTTKQNLFKNCDISSRDYVKSINKVISENRGITIEAAKLQRKIRHKEVLMFYAEIGESIRSAALRYKKNFKR